MRKRLAALITMTICSTAPSEALPLARAASLKDAAAQLQLTEPVYYGYRPYYGYYRPYYRPYAPYAYRPIVVVPRPTYVAPPVSYSYYAPETYWPSP